MKTETTMRISLDCKKNLDLLKNRYLFKTNNDAVYNCTNYILKNSIDIQSDYQRENLNTVFLLEERIQTNLQELEKKLTKDNASLRKWVGAVEKDYFIPILKNIGSIERKASVLDKKPEQPEEIENPLNPPIKSNINIAQNDSKSIKIRQLEDDLNIANKAYKEVETISNRYKKALQDILSQTKVEAFGMMGREKVVINISAEDFKKIKEKF